MNKTNTDKWRKDNRKMKRIRKRESMENTHILKAGDWHSSDIKKTQTGAKEACLVVSLPLCVSLILSLLLCVPIETFILETGKWERDFGRLPISSSPWRPRDRASKERTHTHTLFATTEENSLALCYTENPTFPQSDRQVDSWVLC